MWHVIWSGADVLGALWAALLSVPANILFLEVFKARRRDDLDPPPTSTIGPAPRFAVLVPAHNESTGIGATVRILRAQLKAGDRVLVVADNCSDDTAQVAREAGADVIERHDTRLRGKGHALDFGVRALEADPPDVVIVVDADCAMQPQGLDRLSRACMANAGPTQCLNLMVAPPGAGLKTRIAEFAWVVKNHARPLGYARLGLPCQLMGTGMAFPWSIAVRAPLASSHIVEDLQLGISLAEAGTPPVFCRDACVISQFPSSDAALMTQRTRWEHGHLDVALKLGPKLLWRAVSTGRLKLAMMVIDMCVPPLASLVVLLFATLCGALLLALTGHVWTLALAVYAWMALGSAVAMAWDRFGRGVVSLGELLSVPRYIVAKLPLYLKALMKRQTEWVRTKRDDAPK